MSSFRKGGNSRNSHEMTLFGMTRIGLLMSPSHRTSTANIGIWRGSIPMYASMFWIGLAGDSTSFWCVGDIGFLDAHMIYVS